MDYELEKDILSHFLGEPMGNAGGDILFFGEPFFHDSSCYCAVNFRKHRMTWGVGPKDDEEIKFSDFADLIRQISTPEFRKRYKRHPNHNAR